ncbi:MAG: glutamate 5-kinase [Chloroflexota bacterium]
MYKRIVVKFGTSVLTSGSPQLDHPHMVDLVRQCAEQYQQGRDVVVCTSGAIAVGRHRLGFPNIPNTVNNKQMLAAVGQSRLMQMWERYFEIYGIHVGQILLTRFDVNHRSRYLNARDTLRKLLEFRIVPIINENDAVAVEEIKVGDNDNLSALVSTLAGADLLILLTDQKGLYTADPRSNPNAKLISEVQAIDDDLKALAGGSVSGLGVGGMATKLQAADIARRSGADVVIADGHEPNIIEKVCRGESVGTLFPRIEQPVDNHKKWILAGSKPTGRIIVDGGAVTALCENGRSLLPAGITQVIGSFQRGDTIYIQDQNGKELAKGIARYSSDAMTQIVGLQSDDIESRLGYAYGPVAVHRNDMILI